MRRHPQYAYDMLSPIDYLQPALEITYCHHEKWDGTGYPRGLKGMEIPFAARIFPVVDVWDALISDRPYHKALPVDEVRQRIQADSGKHFSECCQIIFGIKGSVRVNSNVKPGVEQQFMDDFQSA